MGKLETLEYRRDAALGTTAAVNSHNEWDPLEETIVGRIDDAHVEITGVGMPRQLRADCLLAANEIDPDPKVPRGRDGAINGMGRRVIATHRIDSYTHGHRWSAEHDPPIRSVMIRRPLSVER